MEKTLFKLLTLFMVAVGGDLQAQVVVSTVPEQPLIDEPLSVSIAGLKPNQSATLIARTRLAGRQWSSRTTWTADSTGSINPGKLAPSAGDYEGVEPMGWLWSMQSGDSIEKQNLAITDPRTIELEVEVEASIVARYSISGWLARPGVRVRDVAEDGLVGKLFEPEQPGRHPAILVLSGSEGGINETEAALLASRGYTALALAYFNAPGLPKQLVKIPIEYLRDGIEWLAKQDSVDSQRIGVTGASKGGELALLIASRFPQIRAVVATVPSHVAWSGIGGSFQDASWTWQNEPIPYVRTRPGPDFFREFSSGSAALLSLYQRGLENAEDVEAARIPVEKINGPVLVISGSDDQLWPSSEMAEQVVKRLRQHKHPHEFEHLKYDGAGHAIVNVWIPMELTLKAGNLKLGGSVAANARAFGDSRPRVLRFFEKYLRDKEN